MAESNGEQSPSDKSARVYPYHGHDRGVVVTQPRAGEFEERPMTGAELHAREPALKVAQDIYRHANQAGVCYFEIWEIIAKAIQGAEDDRDGVSELDIDPTTHPSYAPSAASSSDVRFYVPAELFDADGKSLGAGMKYWPIVCNDRYVREEDYRALLSAPSSERRPDAPSFEAIMGEGESWRDEMQASPSHGGTLDAAKYRVLREKGICDGTLHFRITDQMDAAIEAALAVASATQRSDPPGPYQPPMVYDPKQGKMVKPGGDR